MRHAKKGRSSQQAKYFKKKEGKKRKMVYDFSKTKKDHPDRNMYESLDEVEKKDE